MRRPCGTYPTPARATAVVPAAVRSAPAKKTVPARRSTIPRIVCRSVVLPAPLRPTTATISSAPTVRSTPHNTVPDP
jgi:hypothetical protein